MVRSEKWTRRWLGVFAVANLLTLAGVLLWSPAVGFDIFNFPHARLTAATLSATILATAGSVIGLVIRRGRSIALWLVAAVQLLRVLPAVAAVNVWPGGDDGSKIGWTGIVLPITAILVLGSLVACAMMLWWGRTAADGGRS